MICYKGQLVQLGIEAVILAPEGKTYGPAKVISLVYLDQPEGQRGVQLDREIGGSRWWLESDVEAVMAPSKTRVG